MSKKAFGVIGVGAFGTALIKELVDLGVNVFAIDKNKECIDTIKDIVTNSAVCDTTLEGILKGLGFEHLDQVIVSIGDIEDNILTTMGLVDLGVKNIAVMVKNEYHRRVVEKLGDVYTISIEELMGRRIARRLTTLSVVDYFNVDEDYGIYEFMVKDSFLDTPLYEMNIRNKYDVSLVLIKRDKETILPKADSILKHGDAIYVVGTHKNIVKFSNVIRDK